MAGTGERILPTSSKKLILEDPMLYVTPQGWESYQKHANKVSLVIVPIFLIIGFLMFYLGSVSTSPKRYLGIVVSFFFIVFALFFLVLLIWSNIDKKDTWHKKLPYSIELYERLNYSMKEMLKNKRYRFSYKEHHGMETVWDKKTGKRYGMQYIIELPNKPVLRIISDLEMFKSRYSPATYSFHVKIHNVRIGNLQNARRLANEINYVLRGIDFKLVPMN